MNKIASPLPIASTAPATLESDGSACESLLRFVHAVVVGVERRGFHIASHESLHPLWNGQALSAAEKDRRLNLFARAGGWMVRSKEHGEVALFMLNGDERTDWQADRWAAGAEIEHETAGAETAPDDGEPHAHARAAR